ncbi:hypothetical protein CBR_g66648 [Chara braunii]|uniref:DUF4283 domain-containing protein n=1 Tax=Chara braunii TaxID=69332 RepID=A0A388JPY0_CHABU|nr:hypothetical protein CBR_g66648 [Chara braunii]|eukprot:GBG59845.1 hypothetical protein CBR_g66648 [Chara braunii]
MGAVRELASVVVRQIRRLATKFLWKPRAAAEEGFMVKVAWDLITFPKELGGLGLMDLQRKNQAQLRKWLAEVAMAEEKDWILLAEKIRMREWQLCRAEDVWLCFFVNSFAKKRLCSEFWDAVRRAWLQHPPEVPTSPLTREEVLRQGLFENQFIREENGSLLLADSSPGSFGKAWIRRGVTRIADLWSELLGTWKPFSQVHLAAVSLPTDIKRRVIRRYENGWIGMPMLGDEPKRGFFRNEGKNLLSYVACNREVAQWMLRMESDGVELDGNQYDVYFKPWISEREIQEWREKLKIDSFWVRCLRIPIAVLPVLKDAVELAFGKVIKESSVTKKPEEPELASVRFNLEPGSKDRYARYLSIDLPNNGGMVEIEVAAPDTPWCPECKGFFHNEYDEECPARNCVDMDTMGVHKYGEPRPHRPPHHLHPHPLLLLPPLPLVEIVPEPVVDKAIQTSREGRAG